MTGEASNVADLISVTRGRSERISAFADGVLCCYDDGWSVADSVKLGLCTIICGKEEMAPGEECDIDGCATVERAKADAIKMGLSWR